jgi:hypothetical protein
MSFSAAGVMEISADGTGIILPPIKAISRPITYFTGFRVCAALRNLRPAGMFLCCSRERMFPMLWTIVTLLLILWLLGMVSSYTLGGFIHLLLVVAIIIVLVRIIQGRSPVV